MPAGTTDRRYAQAVFEIAKDTNTIDQWSEDLVSVAQVFDTPEVRGFLEDPKSSRDQKRRLITNVLQGKVQPTALNLAALLVQRGRQNYASGIEEAYRASVNRLRGIVIATVTTAQPVDAQEAEAIRTKLESITGQKVQIEQKVDPSIIGGVVARIGDTLIDGSVATVLQNMRSQLV